MDAAGWVQTINDNAMRWVDVFRNTQPTTRTPVVVTPTSVAVSSPVLLIAGGLALILLLRK